TPAATSRASSSSKWTPRPRAPGRSVPPTDARCTWSKPRSAGPRASPARSPLRGRAASRRPSRSSGWSHPNCPWPGWTPPLPDPGTGVPSQAGLAHWKGMTSTQESVFRAAVGANVPVFMKGLSGIGKSAFIRDYAQASNCHLESVVLAHKEKSDVGGIPTVREGSDGTTTTEFAVPGWGERLISASKGLLLLSEFNMGEIDVQQACMNVLQERQVGESTYLPESVAIVLDGNPPERYAGSNDLPSQIANRMLHLDWELDRQAW